MNIIMAVIGLVGLKRAPECIKMHHFEGENAKTFLSGEVYVFSRLSTARNRDGPTNQQTHRRTSERAK